MYLWNVKTTGSDSSSGKSRYIVVASTRMEDAVAKAKMFDSTGDERVSSAKMIGSIPAIMESSTLAKLIVYYVIASYKYPSSPYGSNTSRVPTGFLDRIDPAISTALGSSLTTGSMPSDIGDAVDSARIGLFVAVSTDDISDISEVISSQIFDGQIPPEDISIKELSKVDVL